MTATLVCDTEQLNWLAHSHVDKFRAVDEVDTLFGLFGDQARAAERQGLISRDAAGGLRVDPRVELVTVTAADLLRPVDEVLDDGLVLPRITGELMGLVTDPYGTADEIGNLLANAGINRMGLLAFGAGTGQIYNTANSAIGVGDTATAAAATQTDLSASQLAANRWIQIVDSQPTFVAQVLTMVATIPTGNGNFAWAEWAIGQNTTSTATASITAAMLNRKVVALGTKTSAAAWTLTVTITVS